MVCYSSLRQRRAYTQLACCSLVSRSALAKHLYDCRLHNKATSITSHRSKHLDSFSILGNKGVQDADPCAVVDRRSTPRLKETIHEEEWRAKNSPRATVLNQNKASFRTVSSAVSKPRVDIY